MAEMMSAPERGAAPVTRSESFEEFWPYYLKAHSKPETRAMHFVGTTLGVLGIATWLATGKSRYLAAGLAGSYGSAWLGHFAVEGNHPAAFENPFWSLEADLRMYQLWLTENSMRKSREFVGDSGDVECKLAWLKRLSRGEIGTDRTWEINWI